MQAQSVQSSSLDANNLELAQKLLGLKDAKIQALQDQLWAAEEENKLLRQQLAPHGFPLLKVMPSSEKKRCHLLRLEFPPAQRPVQGKMRWDVLARGALLKLILVFLKPQSCLGLLAASKKAQEDFHKSWSRELDLKDFRSRGGLQSFHKFLGRPIWKEAQTLRMPKDARLGLSYRWPNSSMSLIEKCFPDLQELDLSFGGGLFGGGLVKWLEESSTRLHFSQSFAKLTSLKLHVYDFQEADMLVSLTKLRRLHLGLPYCGPFRRRGTAPMLFGYLLQLLALEDLQLFGHRSAFSKANDGHLILGNITNELKQLLASCSRLRKLEIVPCVGLSEEVFAVLCSGKNLEQIALYAPPSMNLQSLPMLCKCTSLRHLRLAREGGFEESVPPLKGIKVDLDALVDPNFFHSETVLR
ncbi:unnamed protein product [Durusdinium trenchii]|uniref:Uncharacterized protein n=2 Tax=Durusdinium trenchii TaxID=1381693 RepID=A0ABP0QX26_9DINO